MLWGWTNDDILSDGADAKGDSKSGAALRGSADGPLSDSAASLLLDTGGSSSLRHSRTRGSALSEGVSRRSLVDQFQEHLKLSGGGTGSNIDRFHDSSDDDEPARADIKGEGSSQTLIKPSDFSITGPAGLAFKRSPRRSPGLMGSLRVRRGGTRPSRQRASGTQPPALWGVVTAEYFSGTSSDSEEEEFPPNRSTAASVNIDVKAKARASLPPAKPNMKRRQVDHSPPLTQQSAQQPVLQPAQLPRCQPKRTAAPARTLDPAPSHTRTERRHRERIAERYLMFGCEAGGGGASSTNDYALEEKLPLVALRLAPEREASALLSQRQGWHVTHAYHCDMRAGRPEAIAGKTYLLYKRAAEGVEIRAGEATGAPGPAAITGVLTLGPKDETPPGFEAVPGFVAGLRRRYRLAVRRGRGADPIVDVVLVRRAADCPPGFTPVQANLAAGAIMAKGAYLCYCAMQEPPRVQGPRLLDHYPRLPRGPAKKVKKRWDAFLELSRTVGMLVFPRGGVPRSFSAPARERSPELFGFVVTLASGREMQGAALRFYEAANAGGGGGSNDGDSVATDGARAAGWCLPRALVLLSYRPVYRVMAAFLRHAYELSLNGGCVETAIARFFQLRAPVAGALSVAVRVGARASNAPHLICGEPTLAWPLAPGRGEHLKELINCLDTKNLIRTYEAVLAETKVLLVSSRLDRLGACGEALRGLLFPLKWAYNYVPVVAEGCSFLITSLQPFLAGCHRDLALRFEIPTDVTIVDLDFNLVRSHDDRATDAPPAPVPLPHMARAALELRLAAVRSAWGEGLLRRRGAAYPATPPKPHEIDIDGVSLAFLLATEDALGPWREFVLPGDPQGSADDMFDRRAYISRRSARGAAMAEQVVASQAFAQLVTGWANICEWEGTVVALVADCMAARRTELGGAAAPGDLKRYQSTKGATSGAKSGAEAVSEFKQLKTYLAELRGRIAAPPKPPVLWKPYATLSSDVDSDLRYSRFPRPLSSARLEKAQRPPLALSTPPSHPMLHSTWYGLPAGGANPKEEGHSAALSDIVVRLASSLYHVSSAGRRKPGEDSQTRAAIDVLLGNVLGVWVHSVLLDAWRRVRDSPGAEHVAREALQRAMRGVEAAATAGHAPDFSVFRLLLLFCAHTELVSGFRAVRRLARLVQPTAGLGCSTLEEALGAVARAALHQSPPEQAGTETDSQATVTLCPPDVIHTAARCDACGYGLSGGEIMGAWVSRSELGVVCPACGDAVRPFLMVLERGAHAPRAVQLLSPSVLRTFFEGMAQPVGASAGNEPDVAAFWEQNPLPVVRKRRDKIFFNMMWYFVTFPVRGGLPAAHLYGPRGVFPRYRVETGALWRDWSARRIGAMRRDAAPEGSTLAIGLSARYLQLVKRVDSECDDDVGAVEAAEGGTGAAGPTDPSSAALRDAILEYTNQRFSQDAARRESAGVGLFKAVVWAREGRVSPRFRDLFCRALDLARSVSAFSSYEEYKSAADARQRAGVDADRSMRRVWPKDSAPSASLLAATMAAQRVFNGSSRNAATAEGDDGDNLVKVDQEETSDFLERCFDRVAVMQRCPRPEDLLAGTRAAFRYSVSIPNSERGLDELVETLQQFERQSARRNESHGVGALVAGSRSLPTHVLRRLQMYCASLATLVGVFKVLCFLEVQGGIMEENYSGSARAPAFVDVGLWEHERLDKAKWLPAGTTCGDGERVERRDALAPPACMRWLRDGGWKLVTSGAGSGGWLYLGPRDTAPHARCGDGDVWRIRRWRRRAVWDTKSTAPTRVCVFERQRLFEAQGWTHGLCPDDGHAWSQDREGTRAAEFTPPPGTVWLGDCWTVESTDRRRGGATDASGWTYEDGRTKRVRTWVRGVRRARPHEHVFASHPLRSPDVFPPRRLPLGTPAHAIVVPPSQLPAAASPPISSRSSLCRPLQVLPLSDLECALLGDIGTRHGLTQTPMFQALSTRGGVRAVDVGLDCVTCLARAADVIGDDDQGVLARPSGWCFDPAAFRRAVSGVRQRAQRELEKQSRVMLDYVSSVRRDILETTPDRIRP